VTAASVVELLHLATLIHDDTVDHADVRRGRTTISSRWGTNVAVLVGDYLFSIAATLACEAQDIQVMRRAAQNITEAAQGELYERFNAFNWRQTREDYWQKIYHKTAALFAAAAEVGAVVSDAPEPTVQALKSYGANLGMAFQVVDDILDFQGTEEEFGKPVGQDLLKGTLTLPSLLLVERHPEDNPVTKAFQDIDREENLHRALKMIRGDSIIEDCYVIAGEFSHKAQQALANLEDSVYRQSLFDLATYVVERRS
jgi:geranylgeranyl pyrophosphate synthase